MTPKPKGTRLEWKMTRIIVVVCAVILFLGGAATLTYESAHSRQEMIKDGVQLAELIAENSSAAVASGDAAAAAEALAPLKFRPKTVSAAFYQRNGRRLAQYAREKRDAPLTLDQANATGHRFEGHELVTFVPVRLGQQVVGTLALRRDVSVQRARLQAYALIAVGLLVGLLVLALGLASLLQRTISRPIHELAQVADRVAREKDYTARANPSGNDEIGLLAEAFNVMLTQIGRQTLSLQDREERLRLITENIREVFWMTDASKSRMIYISPGYERIWGRTCESLYQSPRAWMEAIDPQDRERVLQAALTKQGTGEYDEEYRIFRPDGSVRWIRDRAFPVREESGAVGRIVGIAEDITPRRQAELARVALLLLGTELNAAGSPLEAARVILAAADKLWKWDSASLDLYLPQKDQMQAVLNCDTVDGQRREVPIVRPAGAPSARMRRILKGGPELILHEPPFAPPTDAIMFGDTSRSSASIMTVPLHQHGQAVGVLSLQSYTPKAYTTADLQALQALADHCGAALERIRYNESLQDSEARLRQLAEATFEGVAIISEGKLMDANSQLAAMMGYDRSEMLGRPVLDFIAPESREVVAERIRTGYEPPYEALNLRKDGSVFPAESHARYMTWQGKKVRVTAVRDLTERKRTEDALRDARRHLEAHMANSPLAVIEFGPRDRVIRWSGASEQIFGWTADEIVGKAIHEMHWVHEADAESVRQVRKDMLAGHGAHNLHVNRNYRKDGTVIHCEWYNSALYDSQGRLTSIFSLVLNVTARRQAETQLQQQRDLAAILNQTLDLSTAFEHFLDVAVATPDIDCGVAYLFDPHSGAFQLRGHRGLSLEFVQTISRYPEDSMGARLLRQRRTLDVRSADFRDGLSPAVDQEGLMGWAVLPLVHSGRLIGSINLGSHRHSEISSLSYLRVEALVGLITSTVARMQSRQALIESEDRFRTLFEFSPIAIALHGPDGRILETNQRYQQMLGYTGEELKQLGVRQFTHPEDVAAGEKLYLELLDGVRDHYQREKRYCRKDGQIMWGVSTVSAIRLSGGGLRYIISMVEDITDRKRAEKVTRELASIVEHSADAIIGQTADGFIASWNQTAERIYGYNAAEALGQTLSMLFPPDHVSQLNQAMDRLLEGSRGEEFETLCRRKDGTFLDVSITLSPVRNAEGRLTATSTIARDITERKQLEAEIVRASEEERRRLSQELHDGLGQTLTGIAFKAKAVQGNLAQTGSPLAQDLGEIASLVNGAIADARRLAQGLEPIQIETVGLMAALAGLAADTRHLFGINSVFRGPKADLPVSVPAGATLYRITQEAIHNAVTHGTARTIEIDLAREEDNLRLCVRDDGKGFVAIETQGSGMGLRIMRQRAHAMGGTLQIQSQPGQGTRIECLLPLQSWLAGDHQQPSTGRKNVASVTMRSSERGRPGPAKAQPKAALKDSKESSV